jgi:hypothetical protein
MRLLAEPKYTVPCVGRRFLLGTTLFKVLAGRDSVLCASRGAGVRLSRYLSVLAYRRL